MTPELRRVQLEDVLRAGSLAGASDIHIKSGEIARARVDGALRGLDAQTYSAQDVAELAACALDTALREAYERDGDVTVMVHAPLAARMHVFRTAHGPAIALRLLRTAAPSLDELNVPAALFDLSRRSHGLIIVTGPTGSGKSTLLAALVNEINERRAAHVVTLEDPIEYVHASKKSAISQRSIGRDVTTLSSAVYGALRCDPDVLLIGELRDRETIAAALTAAETGHLVLTTLHASDAPQTVERVVSAFSGDVQDHVRATLAQTFAAAVCLRLIPSRTGGRRAACEILLETDAVRHLIREAKTHQLRNVIATSRAAGMQTLEAHLSELVASDAISFDQARAAAVRPSEIRLNVA